MPAGCGWSCNVCTFSHHAPADRCSMCGSLRVSKQQMTDFILGKPIDMDNNNNNNNKENHADKQQQPSSQQQTKKTTTTTTRKHSSPVAAATAAGNNKPAKRPRRTELQTTLDFTGGGISRNAGTVNHNNHNGASAAASDSWSTMTLHAGTTAATTTTTTTTALAAGPPQQQQPYANRPPLMAGPSANNSSSTSSSQNRGTAPATTRLAPLPPRRQKPPPPPSQQQQNKQQQQKRGPSSLLPVSLPYQPGPVPLDASVANEWIFPVDEERFEKRQYQLEICESAVRHNTLVSLPTGLGKTMVGAVVLYNYHRWFPTGKCIFMAPTIPLVNQQVKACYHVMGIPVHHTAVMTGKGIKAAEREQVWKEKSVFFCSPQTVQNDLETGRLDASQVVCVVLDEAHKATGNYAYCNIINRLMMTGLPASNSNNNNSNEQDESSTMVSSATPQFRILALSATPGSTIKKIQKVVDALRINKVEARLESDPDVAKYIHNRELEVIIVKPDTACRDLERILNDIIGPLLNSLRQRGVFAPSGNATITFYSVFSAMQEYQKHNPRGDPKGVMGSFLAAQALVQWRSDLHQQGINVFRKKLLEHKNAARPKGYLKKIMQGPEFNALCELVEESTSDDDKLLNNPKMTKLREILMEHFERSRAMQKSSRCIVFSQTRDSVGDIVDVLKDLAPLIRPRHFVGQSNGTSTTTASNNSDKSSDDNAAAPAATSATTTQLKGMNQDEQEQVLRQFRDNVYNVLVCTCIGEEGLDIGEVDIIVNFDILSSAVRMIQRVGRTGRKRDGRVVCLVSEGKEYETYKQSKAAEKTLGRALKNPNAFKVVQTIPMLPNDPVRREHGMDISTDSRMSQVEGHAEQTKSKKNQRQPRQASNNGGGASGTAAIKATSSAPRRRPWRISSDAQARREAVFGMSHRISTYSITAMKRRIILARRQQQQQQKRSSGDCSNTNPARCRLGRTTSLLSCFETNNRLREATTVPSSSSHARRGHRRSSDLSLDACFPLTSSEDYFTKLAWGSAKAPPPAAAAVAHATTGKESNPSHHQSSLLPAAPKRSEIMTCSASGLSVAPCEVVTGVREPFGMTRPPLKVVNPYSRNPAKSQQAPSHAVISKPANSGSETNNGLVSVPTTEEFRLPTPDPSSGEDSSDDEAACLNVEFAPAVPVSKMTEADHCVDGIGSGPDLFHETSGGHDETLDNEPKKTTRDQPTSRCNELNHPPSEAVTGVGGAVQSIDQVSECPPLGTAGEPLVQEEHEVNHPSSNAPGFGETLGTLDQEDAFSLPPQDSSSDEDSDDDEEEEGGGDECVKLTSLCAQSATTLCMPNAENPPVEGPSRETNEHRKSEVRFSLDNSTIFTADSFNRHSLDSTADDEGDTLHVKQKGRKTRVLDDSSYSVPCAEISATVQRPTCQSQERPRPAVRFSLDHSTASTLDSIVRQSIETDPGKEDAESVHVKRRQGRKPRAIEDTPDTSSHTTTLKNHQRSSESLENALLDTQESARKEPVPSPVVNADDIVCAICSSGASPDEDPIFLCDGPGGSTVCDLAVHATCYSATIDFNADWRCDPCLYRFSGGTNQIRCLVCTKHTGVLKRVDDDDWIHAGCRNWDPTAAAAAKPRLKKIGGAATVAGEKKETKNKKRSALSNMPVNVNTADPTAVNRKKQRRAYSRFLDDEACIASDDDIEGDVAEDAHLLDIEDEEGLHGSFINDSSQLGYTQDELDKVDASDSCDVDEEEDLTHRALDAERERMNAFATPMLHRRQKRRSKQENGVEDDGPSPESSSILASERGLGKMHFIRSVMEHHRQGGRAEDIEECYQELAGEETQADTDQYAASQAVPGPVVNRRVVYYQESDDDSEEE